jgi:hypothetical protein
LENEEDTEKEGPKNLERGPKEEEEGLERALGEGQKEDIEEDLTDLERLDREHQIH